jgi:hypothetical protein
MAVDRFGRTPAKAKSDRRQILDTAFREYPGLVMCTAVKKDTAERFDIHYLLDHGLLERMFNDKRRGVVADPSFISAYRLSPRGRDQLLQPGWLETNFPRGVSIAAVGPRVNIDSPGATAAALANRSILSKLRYEIERSNLPTDEKSGLLVALDKLSHHPLVVAIVAKLMAGG